MPKKTHGSKDNEICEYLSRTRNFAPSGAELVQLQKAYASRMKELTLDDVSSYIDRLEVDPEEITRLLDAAIGPRDVFFRDPQFWDMLKTQVIPRLGSLKQNSPLRFWTIGCGTGKEAITLAMLLCEAFGTAVFQDHVKIFATDEDENKLNAARHSAYSKADIKSIDPALLKRYFVPAGNSYSFRNDLRRSIIFGKHSLLNDPSISRMDLIMCRHVLVYMHLETQMRVMSRLRFALRNDGCLLLGQGESLTAGSGFGETSEESRVYGRNLRRDERAFERSESEYDSILLRTNEAVVDSSPVAQISIDREGLLAVANEKARATFGLANQDFGRPFQDLEISYRPVELRSLIDKCCQENKPVVAGRVPRHGPNGYTQYFDVYVQALYESVTGVRMGVSVQFNDVSELHQLQDELVSVNQQLQTANEELQSAHEELETTNEELQSTNEELETTNEELQSTNEELETMNEELQSTNAELEIANTDQRNMARSFEQTNTFLQSILSSMKSCVIVVNDKYQIMSWNDHCHEVWGLRADEVIGQRIFDLDIGLPLYKLKAPIRTFMNLKKDFEKLVVEAINRRGRKVQCTLKLSPLSNPKQTGLLILIEDQSFDESKVQVTNE